MIVNQDLHNKIANLDNYIGKNHDATAFIYFKVNNFELDTRKADSREHYAVSLTNQKTGVGAGNQFTLKIVYHRDFDNRYNSANELEYNLSNIRNVGLYSNNKEYAQNLNKNDCYLQYGYLNQTAIGPTPRYRGKLLKYSVKVNKQIVEYTLQGFTGVEATIGIVNWYPRLKMEDNPSRDNNGSIIAEIQSKQETKDLTQEQIKEYIQTLNSVYTGTIVYNPYRALKAFIKDYNYDIDKNVDIADPAKFEVVDESGLLGENDNNNYLKPVTLSLCRNQTPLDYVKYLVSMFQQNATDYAVEYYKKQNGITDRWVYEVKRSPSQSNNIIRIIIRKISSEDKDTYTYRFYNYAENNNLLIEYNLDYDGTVALSVSNTMNSNADNNAIYIRSDGLVSAKASITDDMFVYGAIDEVLVKKQNYWIDLISCANNCTMTTYGMPFEIPVSTVFQINATVGGNNANHHASGCSYVTGVVDKIENNMFTTDFTMVRLPGRGSGVETL